jgi:N-acetylglucosaminyldiphosphoundecaprenol N-acetyl-beta-D-mannosaminyltransferase
VASGEFHGAMFSNAAKVVMADRDPALREALTMAAFVGADGQSLVWASRLLGMPVPERVAGIEYMEALLAVGGRRGWRVFLLGASDEVLGRVVDWCAASHPGVEVVGRRNGYFAPEADPSVAAAITATQPDVVFVGMPSPRKELWIHEHGRATGAALVVASGGSFDVIAGTVRRAPTLWQRLGLEWFWRVVQEPRRLWKRYLTTNTRFLVMLGRAWLRARRT